MTSPTLESWAATLSFLHADIAAGIEPMARRIDLVIDTLTPDAPGAIEPNGYSGLTRNGPLDRLMLSEWMMAGAEPDEFMRKLVSAELGYLELERTEPRSPGQIAVLVDAGPSQIGAPRIAQLAALVVLERRARAHDVPLAIGVLGDDPGAWLTGEFSSVLQKWLQARTAHVSGGEIDGWLDSLESDARVWLLAGDATPAAGVPSNVQVLRSTELSWGPNGATSVSVVVDAKQELQLDLPESSVGVRILRGEGLFRHSPPAEPDIIETKARMRFPGFHSASRIVVGRADASNRLVWASVPNRVSRASRASVSTKSREFSGPVLAAAALGQRIVAMVVVDGRLRVEFVGRRLSDVTAIDVPVEAVGLGQTDIEQAEVGPVAPLFYLSGKLVVRLKDRWWLFRAGDDPIAPSSFVYLAASHVQLDQPRLVQKPEHTEEPVVNRSLHLVDIAEPYTVHMGAGWTVAYRTRAGSWSVGRGPDWHPVEVADGETVLGVTTIGDEAVLVVQSPGRHLLRLRGPSLDRTLTKASRDGVVHSSVHPTSKLIAIERDNGRVDVLNLENGQRFMKIDADPQ